jgi:hypothetical protein
VKVARSNERLLPNLLSEGVDGKVADLYVDARKVFTLETEELLSCF